MNYGTINNVFARDVQHTEFINSKVVRDFCSVSRRSLMSRAAPVGNEGRSPTFFRDASVFQRALQSAARSWHDDKLGDNNKEAYPGYLVNPSQSEKPEVCFMHTYT